MDGGLFLAAFGVLPDCDNKDKFSVFYMKIISRFFAPVLALFTASAAFAAPVSVQDLTGVGVVPQQAEQLTRMCNAPTGSTVDIGVADTTYFSFGTGGIVYTATASSVAANTSDGSDTKAFSVCGGGTATTTRGGCMSVYGNEHANDGAIILQSGGDAGSNIDLSMENASAMVRVRDTTSGTIWQFENDGDLQGSATLGGDIIISNTGKTLAIDSGTAASACKGTGTFNGGTPVTITTTCAATGMVVVWSATASTGSTNCWVSTITNGVSFAMTCSAANTATFSWVIIKEG